MEAIRNTDKPKEIDFTEEECLRFLKYVGDKNDNGCINWLGGKFKRGYGCFGLGRTKQTYKAHRISFWLHGYDLIPGMVIDHICRNTSCINPEHLRQVTTKENHLENSRAVGAINAEKTHCKRGHEFKEGSYRISKTKYGFARYCIECGNYLRRRWRINRRIEEAKKNGTSLRWYKSKHSGKEI